MMYVKFFFRIICLSTVLIFLFSCTHKKNRIVHSFDVDLTGLRTFGDKKQYVFVNEVGGGTVALSSKYLLTMDFNYTTNENGDIISEEKNSFQLVVVDLSKENYPKTKVDLKKSLDEFQEDYFPITFGSVYEYNGKEYLVLLASKHNKGEAEKFIVDTETWKVSKIPVDFPKDSLLETYDVTSFWTTNLGDMISRDSIVVIDGNLHFKKGDAKALRKYKINEEYPCIVDDIIKAKYPNIYVRPNRTSQEEYYQDLRRWFTPLGQDSIIDIYQTDPTVDKNIKRNTFEDYKRRWKEE